MGDGESYDAVVIGAGHNGLVSAAYLAKAGLSVAVFEQRKIVGGAAITEELWSGFRVSRLSYAYSLFDRQIVRELELGKHGLKVVSSDPDLFVPFPDRRSIFVWQDEEKTADEFRKFSEKDARKYHDYLKFWKDVSALLGPMMLSPPPKLGDFASFFDSSEALDALKVLMFSSVSELLDEYFESEEVKAAICPRGLIGTMVGPRTPGSAYILGHHVIGGSSGKLGFGATSKEGWKLKNGQGLRSPSSFHFKLMTTSESGREILGTRKMAHPILYGVLVSGVEFLFLSPLVNWLETFFVSPDTSSLTVFSVVLAMPVILSALVIPFITGLVYMKLKYNAFHGLARFVVGNVLAFIVAVIWSGILFFILGAILFGSGPCLAC